MKHVAVLMGGWSSERPVSLNSGRACAEALEKLGYRVTRLDVTPAVSAELLALSPDVAFNALHGPAGEDGKIQGLLEFLRIPYTHSGVLASALAMNKALAKDVMKAADIPVADGFVMPRRQLADGHPMDVPYVVKPIAEGSSFGVTIVRAPDKGQPPYRPGDEWRHGENVLIERYVDGLELTCAVMNDEALDIIEIGPAGGLITDFDPQTGAFYDYHAKYSRGGSVHTLPARIDRAAYLRIQEWALRAHRALGCRGVTRTDFRYDSRPGGTGEIVALEVNTQPGMTETSLVPEMAAYSGIGFEQLVDWILRDASLDR